MSPSVEFIFFSAFVKQINWCHNVPTWNSIKNRLPKKKDFGSKIDRYTTWVYKTTQLCVSPFIYFFGQNVWPNSIHCIAYILRWHHLQPFYLSTSCVLSSVLQKAKKIMNLLHKLYLFFFECACFQCGAPPRSSTPPAESFPPTWRSAMLARPRVASSSRTAPWPSPYAASAPSPPSTNARNASADTAAPTVNILRAPRTQSHRQSLTFRLCRWTKISTFFSWRCCAFSSGCCCCIVRDEGAGWMLLDVHWPSSLSLWKRQCVGK